METARVKAEAKVFEAISVGKNDEQSFYALCRYFDFLMEDHNLVRILKKRFKDKGSSLYVGAGEALFQRLEARIQTPEAVWSDVMRAIMGKGDRTLILYTKSGAASSVGAVIHNLVTPHLLAEESSIISGYVAGKSKSSKTEIIINSKGISLALDTSKRYPINGRRKKFVWLLDRPTKPLRMKDCAISLGVNLNETFKVSGDKGKINTIFKEKLGLKHDLIQLVSGGYSLNRDQFLIKFKA